MNSLRQELLELTPQALTALSNAGFVKRSLKELENGNVPEISHENGALIATFSDGVRTQLANSQALKEAQCSCGASGMCRHRVMLVLSYQRLCATVQPTEKEEEWDPAIWLEELATLPDATRKRAQALVAKGITIELFCAPGEIPSARLPMSDVRFYSRSSIRFARCDCIEGTLCEHVVLAVQAFVEAKAQQAEFNHLIWQMRSEHVTSSDDPFASEEGQTCRQYVQQLSQALWLGGISQPLIHYEAAFNRALQAAEACNWRWVSESLRQLRASVDAFHTRASHYHAGECLRQLAALNSRLNCAQEMARRDSVGEVPPVPWRTVVGSGIAGECLRQLAALNSRLNCAQEMARRDSVGEVPPVPWRTVVGSGIAGEAKLDHLRLVSLGMRCWQDIEHYGLRIWFTDPDTGSILHLSRSWPRSEQENSPAATRRLFSFQAGALAGGQIVSQAAKRSADGELLLATRNRLSSVVPLSPDAWQMLSAPLRQPGIVALREYLRQRPPACIRPLNQVDNLFILPVAECISLGWDSSRQTLDAQVISGEGEDNLLTLSLPASACSPFAVERMAALLQQTDDPVSLVSGFVSFVDGQLTLEPRVMMTKTRAWALDAETAPVAPLPSASVLPVPSTAHQLLMRCQALLIQLLHNGWRYQEQSAISQAELLANDLSAVGFYRLAHVLGQFRNTESEARVEAMNNGVLLCEQLFPMLQQQG
ncbi:TPA: SWIM zinc finger family protein [Escherichia coli]|nr:SWIM zinc finger family protein [Escherichia coli]